MLAFDVKTTIAKIRNDMPNGVHVHTGTQTPVTIDDVLDAIQTIGETRTYVIKTLMAIYVSTFLGKSDPLWLMLVGNPSSNKTTLVDLFQDAEDVYRLDTMTANPFSSGQRAKEKPVDLLPLIDGKCFMIKEYGTIFGRSDEMVKQLISDLVAIYDGEYAKHSPTRGTVRYKASFSHIGCVTPMALNKRQRYMDAVGARFLFLRIQPYSTEEKCQGIARIWSNKSMDKTTARAVVTKFCLQLKEKIDTSASITFTDESQSKLNNYAYLIARARGIVITDKITFKNEEGDIQTHYEPSEIQIEEPFRALKQIKKLAGCLAMVNGNKQIGKDEIEIIRMVTLSSMPVRRADVLRVFEKQTEVTAKQAAEFLKKNYKTVKRNFDELVAIGVLSKSKGLNDLAQVYTPYPKFLEILTNS